MYALQIDSIVGVRDELKLLLDDPIPELPANGVRGLAAELRRQRLPMLHHAGRRGLRFETKHRYIAKK